MNRRVTPGPTWPLRPWSQAGLGGPDEDPAAVLAAQHLVRIGVADGGQLRTVELDPAPLARARLQQRCPGAAGLGADAVVERQERLRQPARDLRAGRLVPLRLVGDVCPGVIAQLLGPLAVLAGLVEAVL